MAKKRGHGEGSIYQLPNGKWRGQVSIGRDNITGKLIRKSITGKTRQEVSQKMTKILHQVQTGTYIEPSMITLEQWLNDWLKGRKPHIEESTWAAYETMARVHIIPSLGQIKLKDIKTRDIQNLLNDKLENGRQDGKGGLSTRTVKYIYSTLLISLKQAVKERLIPFNPAEAVELPKQKKGEMRTLTPEELTIFLRYASESRHYPAFILELATGLRRGELLALRWSDIDFKNGLLSIQRQLVRSEKGLVFKDLKTTKSKRTLTLHNDILEVLKVHKKKQAEYKLLLGPAYQDNGLLFCTADGKPLDPQNFVRHYKGILRKANIPPTRFHDLRHTFATLSLQAGIPAKTIQEYLGHSTISTTMDTYSHVTKQMQIEAASKISEILNKVQKG